MQIRITFINADVQAQPAKGKGQPYNMLEVTYKDDKGQTKAKKLASFSNPSVFATLKDAQKGDVFDIEMVKNGEYWNWTSVSKVDGSVASEPASSPGFKAAPAASAPGRSNFETPEERALRQRLIVRQSSITAALKYYEQNREPGVDYSIHDVFATAELVHDWVYQKPDLFSQPNDNIDDLPF